MVIHRAPYLMGERVLVLVCDVNRGGMGKVEFKLTVIREQAAVGPTCFVLVAL